MTYAEALLLAGRAAPLLEIKTSEFKMRRNERELRLLDLVDKAFAKAILAQLVGIDRISLFFRVLLCLSQKLTNGLIQHLLLGTLTRFRAGSFSHELFYTHRGMRCHLLREPFCSLL